MHRPCEYHLEASPNISAISSARSFRITSVTVIPPVTGFSQSLIYISEAIRRIRPRIHIIADSQALYTQYLQRISQQKPDYRMDTSDSRTL